MIAVMNQTFAVRNTWRQYYWCVVGQWSTDSDECTIRNGGCSDTCEDKIIGYECKCPSGYAIKGNKSCHGTSLHMHNYNIISCSVC